MKELAIVRFVSYVPFKESRKCFEFLDLSSIQMVDICQSKIYPKMENLTDQSHLDLLELV